MAFFFFVSFCSEELKGQPTSIVRELHVYGLRFIYCLALTCLDADMRQARPFPFTAAIPKNSNIRFLLRPAAGDRGLHYCLQGFGTLLMEEAERIARDEHGSFKLAVISCHFRRSPFTRDVLLSSNF